MSRPDGDTQVWLFVSRDAVIKFMSPRLCVNLGYLDPPPLDTGSWVWTNIYAFVINLFGSCLYRTFLSKIQTDILFGRKKIFEK